MKDIILKNGVPQGKVEDWLLSIAFIRRPDESMLESLVQLLENRPNEAAVALSIAALTRSYCTQNNNCIQNEAVNKIVNLLQDAVLAYKSDKRTRETEDAVSDIRNEAQLLHHIHLKPRVLLHFSLYKT